MMKMRECLARLLRRTCRAGWLPAVCAALAGAGAQAADPPDLLFPVRCEIGRDCRFFACMDLQSGPAYRDYRCGLRTYEGHKGTDIAPVIRARGCLSSLRPTAWCRGGATEWRTARCPRIF